VSDFALELLRAVLNVEFAWVLRQPSDGAPLVVAAGQGWEPHVKVGESTIPCDPKSQPGFALAASQPIVVGGSAEDRFVRSRFLSDHDVQSGISGAIPGQHRPLGVLGVHSRRQLAFTTDDADFVRTVANIISGAVQGHHAREQIRLHAASQARRVRFQVALTECAQALLAGAGSSQLAQAVESLLAATQATYVFVERNVVDPESGLCSQTVVEVEQVDSPGAGEPNEYWELVPWKQMPISRSHLEKGEPFVVIPEQLHGVERALYAADPTPIKSELNIPIFMDGEWAGLIGFADSKFVREWTPEDLSLLTTAAAMIGAFWEREAAREELESLLLAKDEFLASVSHELRTPLTAVVGLGEVLRDTDNLSADERRELLEMVVGQGMDLTNIVNDLLVAARADIGKLHIALVRVSLRAQAGQVLEMLDPEQVGNIELTGRETRGMGDPDRVRQILRNLISNALRYGGDTIRVHVEENETTARMLVADNGSAIPAEDRERIFEPYQRAHNTPGLPGSIGLGLAICRQLGRLMGGDLTYRHESGESIFELSLPRLVDQPDQAPTPVPDPGS
jgi:signal transduction histidine kinase